MVHIVWFEEGRLAHGRFAPENPDMKWLGDISCMEQLPGHDQVADALRAREEENVQIRTLLRGPRPWVTWVLIGLNVFYFVLYSLLVSDIAGAAGSDISQQALTEASQTAYVRLGVNSVELTLEQQQYWRLLASMFLHFGILHLIINMMALLSLGTFVEKISGHRWILLIYLISGLVASGASVAIGRAGFSAGASGAIMGVVGALLVLRWKRPSDFPKALAQRIYQSLMRSVYLIFGLGLAVGLLPGSIQLDNWAHFGGMAAGFVLSWLFPMALTRRLNRMV